MLSGDGLSDLNLYLNIIGQEVERKRRVLDGLTDEDRPGMELGAQLVVVERNYRRAGWLGLRMGGRVSQIGRPLTSVYL